MGLAEMPDYRAAIARCSLIVGADDAKFLAIARGLPAPLTVIPGAGHDVPLEQPELLASAIRQANSAFR
jgi:pimeloyl-ACP methyl ester carboxylesterase